MPGGGHMGAPLLAAVKAGGVTMAKIDDSVMRILTQMYKFGTRTEHRQSRPHLDFHKQLSDRLLVCFRAV